MERGNITLILVGVVAAVAIAGGIFYLGRITTPKTQSANQVITSQQNSSVAASPSAESNKTDGTTNWKIHTFNNANLSFSYPPTWVIKSCTEPIDPREVLINCNILDSSSSIRVYDPTSLVPAKNLATGEMTDLAVTTELIIGFKKTNLSVKAYVDSLAGSRKDRSYNDFQEGRKSVQMNIATAEIYPDIGKGSSGENIVLPGESGLVLIHIIGKVGENNTTNQILSTFKFLK